MTRIDQFRDALAGALAGLSAAKDGDSARARVESAVLTAKPSATDFSCPAAGE